MGHIPRRVWGGIPPTEPLYHPPIPPCHRTTVPPYHRTTVPPSRAHLTARVGRLRAKKRVRCDMVQTRLNDVEVAAPARGRRRRGSVGGVHHQPGVRRPGLEHESWMDASAPFWTQRQAHRSGHQTARKKHIERRGMYHTARHSAGTTTLREPAKQGGSTRCQGMIVRPGMSQ